MVRGRFLLLLLVSILVLSACGGDDTTVSSTTAVSSEQAAGTETSSVSSEPVEEPAPSVETAAPSTEEPVSGTGQAVLVFDDGRSWTLEGVCKHTPENTGAGAALWSIETEAADSASLIALRAFPFDPDNTTPFVTGSFVDGDGNVFVVIEAEDVSDGSDLIVNLGMHDGVKTIEDPIDFTATVTCGL